MREKREGAKKGGGRRRREERGGRGEGRGGEMLSCKNKTPITPAVNKSF